MTIEELQTTKIIDENEYVCILEGDVSYPKRVFVGRLYNIPEKLLSKSIQESGVGAMTVRRRNSLYLSPHEWLQIWIED